MKATHAKPWVGLALALSIALNTLLPFFATYSDTTPPSGLASIFGEKVLICTSEGFTWVKLEDLLAGKSPAKPHKSYFCPLCYIANDALGKVLLLTAALYLLHAHTARRAPLLRYAEALASHARAASYSRAPPLSFSY